MAYEPNIGQQDLLNNTSPPDYNGRKIQVFDLQEFDGVEIEFPWAQTEMFCKVPQISFLEGPIEYNPAYTPSYNNLFTPVLGVGKGTGFANGFFEVLVVNDLTAAIPDPPPIEINVYVSMADLEVAAPGNNSIGDFAYNLPARIAEDEEENTEEEQDEVAPIKFESELVSGKFDHDMGIKTEILSNNTVDQAFQVCFGERIKSFRSLIKRPQTLFYLNGANQTNETYLYMNAFPNNYRYYQFATPFWFSAPNKVNLFSYLRGAYVGMRGGFRYTMLPYNFEEPLRAMSADQFSTTDQDPSLFSPNNDSSAPVGHTGVHYAIMSSNPSLSFECPYYEASRFVSAQGTKLKGTTIFPHSGEVRRVRVGIYSNFNLDNDLAINVTAVPADDFSFIGRVGAPPAIRLWD